MTSVICRETQSAPSGLANSRSPASPTPSAHRTGAPTARSRSNRTTSSSGAASFACHAATAPAGPAPTTRMSTSGIGEHRERPDGAGGDTFLASGAACVVHGESVQLEMDGLRRAPAAPEAAAVADPEGYA